MQTIVSSQYVSSLIQKNDLEKGDLSSKYRPSFFTSFFYPKWKQRMLWVTLYKGLKGACLPTDDDRAWLTSYLTRSPIDAVCLSADLGEASLTTWVEACRVAKKPAFLRLPSRKKFPPTRKGVKRRLKQGVDWITAMLILFFLSTIMLGLILFIRTQRNQPALMREWCVGHKGRFFQLLTFAFEYPPFLSQLPSLINVVRGETNLARTDHLKLHDLYRD